MRNETTKISRIISVTG